MSEQSSAHRPWEGFSFVPESNGSLLTVPRAPEPAGGVIAFSTRLGGFSDPPFDSFNFSTMEGDREEDVGRNIDLLGNLLRVDPRAIVFCRQVHRADVEALESIPRTVPIADALIAVKPGIFPAVRTADCPAVLLLDPVGRISAAVHAGWKGTALRITGKVVRILKEDFAVDPVNLTAAIGPAIGPCCYEVDEGVLGPFLERFPEAESCISVLGEERTASRAGSSRRVEPPGGETLFATPLPPTRPDHESFRLDLIRANLLDLLSEGVPRRNVRFTGLCTACYSDLFFSYRRRKGRTGRLVAVTGFKV